MKKMSKIFLLASLLGLSSVQALEVDEKLTMRILDASVSKKTVLLNRGLEDGLVVGDHAKFFITTGVIARGVVVKASPSRSIWSIYRLVKPQEVSKGLVANIKISTPVKLTNDSSKSIRALTVPANQMGEPNDVFPDKKLTMSGNDANEVNALLQDEESVPVVSASSPSGKSSALHSLEISALLSMSTLSGTYTNSSNSFDAKNSSMNFSGAIEKYFPTSTSFLRNVSLKLMAARTSQETGTGVNNIATLTDLGGGAAYYFGKGPHRSNSLMYFIDGNIGMSTAALEIQDNVDTSSNASRTLDGAGSFFSVGAGAKYLVGSKFGAMAKLDYYKNTSSFDIDENGTITTDELAISGPRVMFGLFYRFF
jgi:hypothetical protein